MRRWIASLLVIAPLLATTADPVSADGGRATSRQRFVDPEARAATWDDPERHDWQKPMTVFRMLGLAEGQEVADLGAGTGYFTRLLSSMVGVSGKVYAVDVEQAMLDHIVNRDDLDPGMDNIIPVLADPNDPKLPEGELDVVLIVNTWHHIDRRVKYLRRLIKSVKPSGSIGLIDWRMGDLPMGPPEDHRLSRERVIREFEKVGWQLDAESVALPYQYFLIFLPPGRD
jgi:predicted methyltransferase